MIIFCREEFDIEDEYHEALEQEINLFEDVNQFFILFFDLQQRHVPLPPPVEVSLIVFCF